MTKDGILCLIEGAKVVDVDFRPDRETEYGKGVEVTSAPSFWYGETVTSKLAFWDLLKDIMDRKTKFLLKKNVDDYFIYFGYHVTNEPMTWEECEFAQVAASLGVPTHMSAWDHYSDLTGYLWTTINVEVPKGERNVWNELNSIVTGRYLTLRFEIKRKENS